MDRNLRIRMLLEAGDRVTKPLRDIAGGSNKAAEALRKARDELKSIEKAQSDIAGFRALKTGMRQTAEETRAARARLAEIRKEIAGTEQPTRKMTRALEQAERQVAALTQRGRDEVQQLRTLRSGMDAAGISTRNLAAHQRELESRAEAASRSIRQQSDRVRELADRQRRFDAARGAFSSSQDKAAKMAIAGGAAIGVGVAAVSPIRSLAADAIQFESAMADVRKTVDGLDDAAAFRKMSDDILDLSTRLPMVPEGIAAIVAAGGQIKIPRAELLQFAEDATKMGIAFDMTGDEAGQTMAKWRAAFGLGRDGVIELANKVNLLGNSGANTLAVTDIVTRIGPLGGVAGLASGEIAGLAATLDSMGVQSEIAATGIKNTMLALTKGAAATKSQRAAFEDLGLDAERVAQSMQKNAAGTIVDVMQRIRNLSKEKQSGILTELFGSESVGAIAPMLTQLPKLQEYLRMVGDASAYAGSMDKEYASKASTTANSIQLAENNLTALKVTLGTDILPMVTDAAKGFGDAARSIRAFAQEHPAVASGLLKIVAAFGILMGLAGSFLFIGAGMTAGLAPLRFAAKIMGIELGPAALKLGKALLTPLRLLPMLGRAGLGLAMTIGRAGVMLLANPMVLAIVALAAVIGGAVYLIVKHWSAIKAAFFGALASLKGLLPDFKAIGSMMLNGLLMMLDPGRLAAHVIGLGKRAISAFKNVLGIRSPSRVFAGLGGYMMQGLSNGIGAGERQPLRRVDTLAQRLTAAMAVGAMASAPASADSGDQARILAANPPPITARTRGNTSQAPAPIAAAAAPIVINIYGAPGQSPQELARAMRAELEKIRREEAAARRGRFADTPDWTDI